MKPALMSEEMNQSWYSVYREYVLNIDQFFTFRIGNSICPTTAPRISPLSVNAISVPEFVT
jgi:hypothetical protein